MLRRWCRIFASRVLGLIEMSSGYAGLAGASIYGIFRSAPFVDNKPYPLGSHHT